MLIKFMYTAYDDSARVMSSLMDYKLMETVKGVKCSGPDKEKIMKALTDHHVNYVISELGNITEIRKFDDNQYSKYLALGKGMKTVPSFAGSSAALKNPANLITPQEPPKAIEIPTWLCKGTEVEHKTFGRGTICAVDGTQFEVLFQTSSKKFIYPEPFDKGFIKRIE